MEAASRNPADQQTLSGQQPQPADPNVHIVFREIHKNAWLRRLPTNDRKMSGGAYSKRGENVWVVFCVHDDRDPFLEVYVDQKLAISHRPDWCAPLSTCLHISPTICASPGDQYEFVVTLRNGVIKLAAPTWDVMMEWVNSLRSKLVEMKILSPQENVYSQAPIAPRGPLLPTRDPNSPLPPTPAGPLAIVPGTEMPANPPPVTGGDRAAPGQVEAASTEITSPAPLPAASTPARTAAPDSTPSTPTARTSISTTTSLYIRPSEPPIPSRSTSVTTEAGQNVTVIQLDGPIETTSSSSVFNFDLINSTISDSDLSHYERLYLGQTSSSDPNEPISPLMLSQESPIVLTTPEEPASIPSTSAATSRSEAVVPQREKRPSQSGSANPRRNAPSPNRSQEVPRRKRGPRLEVDLRRPLLRQPLIPPILTLREQQVLQITREIRHPGGVRLQLRKKDCIASIAFVDAFGAVWIAGWKQREHPNLYNALHIGDRLLSVSGVLIPNATEANNLIKSCTAPFVEIIVRRVPFGRVFAIRKDAEGQDVGLEMEGGSAEIKNVHRLSPAGRAGVPPKAPSCDGLSLCNWVLTEVNSRPLNLFFKDGEVKDRLGAVGTDISILIQPFDLIKQIKKQLKSLKSHKDYLVQ